jgi:hypothetical protein
LQAKWRKKWNQLTRPNTGLAIFGVKQAKKNGVGEFRKNGVNFKAQIATLEYD